MKQVNCPLPEYPGTVTLSEPLTMLQALAFQESQQMAGEYLAEVLDRDGEQVNIKPGKSYSELKLRSLYIPGILACVEKWELQNFPAQPTAENFPGSPAVAVAQLLEWLIDQVLNVITGAQSVPNE